MAVDCQTNVGIAPHNITGSAIIVFHLLIVSMTANICILAIGVYMFYTYIILCTEYLLYITVQRVCRYEVCLID